MFLCFDNKYGVEPKFVDIKYTVEKVGVKLTLLHLLVTFQN